MERGNFTEEAPEVGMHHQQIANFIRDRLLPEIDEYEDMGSFPDRDRLSDIISDSVYGPDDLESLSLPEDMSDTLRNLVLFSSHDLGHVSPLLDVGMTRDLGGLNKSEKSALLDAVKDTALVHEGLGLILGAPLSTEEFSLSDIARRIFNNGSRRLAYASGRPGHLHVPIDPMSREAEKELDGHKAEQYFASITRIYDHTKDEVVINGHEGATFLTAYNIFKNGMFLHEHLLGRAFDSPQTTRFNSFMDKMGKDNIEVHIEATDAGEDAIMYIWDNAVGFDITSFKEFVANMVQQDRERIPQLAEDGVISVEFSQAVADWHNNPFDSFRVYPLLTETMFISRFSNSLPWSTHSGVGLYGAHMLAERLGVKIVVGEQADGGAVFALVIPKDIETASHNDGSAHELASLFRPDLLKAA